MTDINKINEKIIKAGLKKGYIAERLGINQATLSRKLNNDLKFKNLEIKELCEILNIVDDSEKKAIFFD